MQALIQDTVGTTGLIHRAASPGIPSDGGGVVLSFFPFSAWMLLPSGAGRGDFSAWPMRSQTGRGIAATIRSVHRDDSSTRSWSRSFSSLAPQLSFDVAVPVSCSRALTVTLYCVQ